MSAGLEMDDRMIALSMDHGIRHPKQGSSSSAVLGLLRSKTRRDVHQTIGVGTKATVKHSKPRRVLASNVHDVDARPKQDEKRTP
jgi:hypothetical protein